MATIKSYTDLEQSKKLADILPLESADMYYSSVPVREWKDKGDTSKGTHVVFKDKIFALENLPNCQIGEGDTYAWSLAALLGVLIYPHIEQNCMGQWVCRVEQQNTTYLWEGSNPIDSCYEMIIKLKELNLL